MRALLFLLATTVLSAAGPAVVLPARVGVGPGQRALSIEDAVHMALGQNLDIAIERTNVDSAAQSVRGARGAFDPVFRWQPGVNDSNQPTPSLIQSANAKLTYHSAGQALGFHQDTPWNGLSMDVSFSNQRVTPGDLFATFKPFYLSQLTMTVTQPLWRGRASDAARALVTIRAHQKDVSAAQLTAQAIDVASRTEQAYWDLVALRSQADVNAEAVDLAQTQLKMDRRRIDAGSLAAIELSAAGAELEKRRDDLYRTSGAVTESENALKTLLAAGRADAIWNQAIEPTTPAGDTLPQVMLLDDAIAQALRDRPELKQLDAQIAANRTEAVQNRDLTKPQINLVATYSLAGLAGTLNALPTGLAALDIPVAVPSSAIGGQGASLASLFGGNYQSVQAGLQFSFTGRNRAAEAGFAESKIAARRLELMRTRAEQVIAAQVRNALEAIETARQRVRASSAASHAAKDKLESESRLFATGESTNFLVLTRQNEYSDARRRQVEAETAVAKAAAQYRAAVGEILAASGVAVQ